MNIADLDLLEGTLRWKVRYTKRAVAEQPFLHFTGHSDIVESHIPYTQYGYWFRMLDVTDALACKKILVLAGDNLNMDLFSTYWHRSDEPCDEGRPYRELETLIKLLRCAEQVYDHILYMETNHDKRIYKMIYRMMEEKQQAEELSKFIKPIQEIFMDNKLNKITVLPDQLFQIGDIIITHFENNSKVPGSVPRQLVKYLIPRIRKPWTVVYQAHTHYQSKLPIMGKWCIETGAMCYSQDYWQQPKVKSEEKVPSIGYAVAELNDGIADVNKCNFVWCDWDRFI